MICNKIEYCAKRLFDNNTISDCPNNLEKCRISVDCRAEIACKENRRSYILQNTDRKNFLHYLVDGGMVCDELTAENIQTCKCDHLLLEKDYGVAILVELKGKNTCRAMEQITETIRRYQQYLKKYKQVYARIIMTKGTPKFKADPKYIKLMKTINGLKNGENAGQRGEIKLKENVYKEKYANLSKC